MLVGTFEIHVGRVGQVSGVRAAQDMPVRGAGIEPDIERVLHLDVLVGLGTEEFGGIQLEPGFDALFLDALGNLLDQFGSARVRQRGFLVQEEGNRHAPVALARDAPVRTGLHHGFQSGAPPGREELRFIDGALGNPAQGRGILVLLVLHADEPLRRGAEDDRRLVAPAVRVAVLDFLGFEQSTATVEFLQHQRIGFPDRLAGQLAHRQGRGVAEETAIIPHRIIDRQAVFLADREVVRAMRRRGVHQAGTGFGRDVGAADDGHVAVLERVPEQDLVELVALAGGDGRHRSARSACRQASASSRTRIRAPFSVSIRS